MPLLYVSYDDLINQTSVTSSKFPTYQSLKYHANTSNNPYMNADYETSFFNNFNNISQGNLILDRVSDVD